MAASSGASRRSTAARRATFALRELVAATAVDASTTSARSIRSRRGTQRQANDERGPGAFLALDADGAAVTVDDVARAGQADACATDAPLDVARSLKPLEDAIVIPLRNANAVIFHFEDRPVPVALQRQLDVAPLRAVLHGVVQQVGQNPSQAAAIPIADQLSLIRDQPQRVAFRGVLVLVDDLRSQLHQIRRLTFQI